MGTRYQRRRLWIDPPFQSRLLLRVAAYFLLYAVVAWHIAFSAELLRGIATDALHKGFGTFSLDYFRQQQPLLVAVALLAPVALYDMLKFSHRLAGPLYRCRRMMEEMAAGKPVPEFRPREHDLMREFSQAFNALIKECNARAKADEDAPAGETDPEGVLATERDPGVPVGAR